MKDRIEQTIRKLDNLPTLPVVVALLNKELASPTATATSIAKIIEDDPPIMARVLKLVNSPIYAPSFNYRKDITIQGAVVRLGMNALRDLVITTSVLTLFEKGAKVAFNRDEFWKHCICAGLVAETVSGFAKVKIDYSESEIILAGLCHDIGKIVLDQYFHDEFVGVLEAAEQEKLLLYVAEERFLGVDHGKVGGLLAERWDLPESIRTAIQYHHHIDRLSNKKHEALVHLVALADYICNHQNLGFSGNFAMLEFPKESFLRLGMEVKDIPEIIERVQEQSKKSEILLGIGEEE